MKDASCFSWWHLCNAGYICAHTKRIVANLFPSWRLGQTSHSVKPLKRIFTWSVVEPLLLLFPVKCYELGPFQSNCIQKLSTALENAPQSSHASHPIPCHPISGAACRDCLWVAVGSLAGDVCVQVECPTCPGGLVLAGPSPRIAASVLCLARPGADGTALWMQSRHSAP